MQSHKPSRSAAAALLLGLIRGYIALLSPFLGGACKFYPSCSNYAYEAISLYGAGRGAMLALKRIGRCHPFRKGGFDPVPEPEAEDNDPAVSNGAGVRSR